MINFPTLNLSLNINPVAFHIFGINIYWYAVCIVVGIIIAFVLCIHSKQNFGIDMTTVWDCFIISIIFGFLGARIYYVLFNLDYYLLNPRNILNFRDGGLAIYGGLLAGGIAIMIVCRLKKVDTLDFLDYMVPFVVLAQSIGRWGNFFNIEAYGTPTTNIFRMGINTITGYQEVHPTFLYESFGTFIIFFILRLLQKNRKFKGQIFYFYLLFYSGIRMIIEGIRADSLMLGNFRISQILSIIIFVISGIMLLKKVVKNVSRKICSPNC